MKLFAKKSLGQHFLNSTHVLEQIIAAGNIQKGENVLEIGPGTGVLTRALLEAGANVCAVEKDQRAMEILKMSFEKEISSGQLRLIEGDVLETNISFEELFGKKDGARNKNGGALKNNGMTQYALIANIPYYITGAILEKFLEHEPRPNRMILLVQKEVAERIVARDGKESVLSVSVKAFGTPKIIAKVPPGAFTPPPTVDSAILSITNISDTLFREKAQNIDIAGFFKIVKVGFAHKRKFVVRNLEIVLNKGKIAEIWKTMKLDPKIRAEDMNVGEWVEILSLLQ